MNLLRTISLTGVLLGILLVLALPSVQADPAHKLVAAGNEAFAAGEYEKALALYDEATVEMPESAQLYFNRGTVLYKQEDYEDAKTALKDAALRSVEPALASRAKFNLGNCAFRQAERQRDSDPKKALEYCKEAIGYYQEARDLDQESPQASENIEIVRLFMKILFDEQQKREEQQQQNQEQEENIVQKLQKLIERQNGLLKENGTLAEQKPEGAVPDQMEAWKKSLADLGAEQGVLRDDTQAVLEEIEQTRSQIEQQAATAGQGQDPSQAAPSPQGQPSPEEMKAMAEKFGVAAGHVTNAIGNEQAARSQLAAAAQTTAARNQEAAVRSLEEAVKALADPNQEQQQQGGDQQENQDQQEEGDEQQQQDPQSGEQEENQDEQEKNQDQKEGDEKQDGDQQQEQSEKSPDGEESEEERQARARMEKAEDILDEEKKQRRPLRPLRGVPVDRDW